MRKLLNLLFICIYSHTNAQTIPLIHYSTFNSVLPENSVRCITFENDSTVWIGTDAGLAKFQGSAWTIYHPSNSGLPWDDVRVITIDKNHDKWIGTSNGGFAQFDGINWTVSNTINSQLPDDFVRSFAFDTAGVKWIGSGAGGGLSEISLTNKWNIYDMFSSPIGSNTIAAIYIDSVSNDKYIGTINGGLLIIHDSIFTNYTIMSSAIPDNTIMGITKDLAGNVWVASPANGLFAKVPTSGSFPTWVDFSPFNSSIQSYGLTSIDIDPNQNLWLGSVDSGLIWKRGSTFFNVSNINSTLADNHVNCVRVAPDGKIWFGTSSDGLYILDPAILSATDEIKSNKQISVFPNPAKEFININAEEKLNSIIICDLNGKEILNYQESSNNAKVNLQNLKSGNYLLRIEFKSGYKSFKEITVE